jgi:hypothetical protein
VCQGGLTSAAVAHDHDFAAIPRARALFQRVRHELLVAQHQRLLRDIDEGTSQEQNNNNGSKENSMQRPRLLEAFH